MSANLLIKCCVLLHDHLSGRFFLSLTINILLWLFIPQLLNHFSFLNCPFSEKLFFLMPSFLFPESRHALFFYGQITMNISVLQHVAYSWWSVFFNKQHRLFVSSYFGISSEHQIWCSIHCNNRVLAFTEFPPSTKSLCISYVLCHLIPQTIINGRSHCGSNFVVKKAKVQRDLVTCLRLQCY